MQAVYSFLQQEESILSMHGIMILDTNLTIIMMAHIGLLLIINGGILPLLIILFQVQTSTVCELSALSRMPPQPTLLNKIVKV